MRVIISLSGTTPILKWRGCFLSHFGVYFFFGGGGGGGVFWSHLGCLDGRYYTCPFRYHLVLCIKKLTKKCHWPHRNLPNAPTTGIRGGGGGRWLRRHSVNRDSPHTPLFQRNSNAPINVNPVGRECGQRTGIWCLRLSPPSGFWSCEEIPGSEHLTLTDRSLVSIQKWLPSPSLEAFWKSHCWRKVWSFHLF